MSNHDAGQFVRYSGSLFWGAVIALAHGIAVLISLQFPTAQDRTIHGGDIAALLLPLTGVVAVIIIHACKQGLSAAVRNDTPEYADHIDSAINRQSIYSAISVGVIAALLSVEALTNRQDMRAFTMMKYAVTGLGASTLFSMMAVVCYWQASRWTRVASTWGIRRSMVTKGEGFDQASWYAFIVGLAWTIAIYDASLSIGAHFAYNACLFIYYFTGWEPTKPVPAAPPVTSAVKAGDQHSLDAALATRGRDVPTLGALSTAVKAHPTADTRQHMPDTVRTALDAIGDKGVRKAAEADINAFYGL